jgi:4'-phosphopantetheinyl transferase
MMLEIYAVSIPSEIPPDVYNRLLSSIPNETEARIRKFLVKKSAYQTLCGELLIRNILSKKLSVSPDNLTFVRNSYGKPSLANSDATFFNIAHSNQWVIAAFDTAEIGVDVEYIHEIDLTIAERFFSKKEHDTLMQKESDKRLSSFYDIWTLKESYIKAVGKGLSIPLNSFCFTIDNKGSVFFELFSGKHEPHYFKQYNIDPQYKCAICSSTDKFPSTIKTIKWDDLCREFL